MSRHFNQPGWLAGQQAKDWDDTGNADLPPSGDNAAHAPGNVCELCRGVIEAGQDARLRPDGNWIHEACPIR
jgi:hypothetical protein